MSAYLNTQLMDVQQYFTIPPIISQRDVVVHSAKIKKYLKDNSYKSMPTLLDVHVAVYPSGKRVLINGNTRKYVWMNPGKFAVDVPTHVRAHMYMVENNEDAVKLYLSFDNQKAAETGGDKITGGFRMIGLDNLQTRPIRDGRISSHLQAASMNTNIDRSDTYAMVDFWKKEITFIDQFQWNIRETGKNIKTFWPSFVAASLMMLKKYGTSNKKLNVMLGRLASNSGGGSTSNDAVDKILYVWQTGKTVDFSVTSNSHPDIDKQLDFILYCLERGLEGEEIKRVGSKCVDTYKNFWKPSGL